MKMVSDTYMFMNLGLPYQIKTVYRVAMTKVWELLMYNNVILLIAELVMDQHYL